MWKGWLGYQLTSKVDRALFSLLALMETWEGGAFVYTLALTLLPGLRGFHHSGHLASLFALDLSHGLCARPPQERCLCIHQQFNFPFSLMNDDTHTQPTSTSNSPLLDLVLTLQSHITPCLED